MIHWLRTKDYCFLSTYLCKFFHFLDNDDRMSSKRRNLSALVFLINLITIVLIISLFRLKRPISKIKRFAGINR